MQRLMARKERVIQDQAKGILELLHHHKIRYVRGKGSIAKPGLAVVQPENGDILEVPWDKLILAPGTQPFDFPAFPFDGRRILSSNDALCLQEVPASIMIVGGGVIGCEFAFLLAALGSQVTVVEAMDRLLPLPSVDEDCSKVVQREMKKRKIKFMADTHGGGRRARRRRPPRDHRAVPFGAGPGGKASRGMEVDKMLVSIGRRPNTAAIGLEKLGVKLDKKDGFSPMNEWKRMFPVFTP